MSGPYAYGDEGDNEIPMNQEEKTTGELSHTRRQFLRAGAGLAAAGAAAAWLPTRVPGGVRRAAADAGATGNFEPYPIPWLDMNLHHNQVPEAGGPPTELSHIFNFKGQVGRALLEGKGTASDGRTLYIGKGTDFGYMQGEYLPANGDARFGIFTHT